MKRERNEVTVEELLNLIQSKEGEFIIHVELEEGGDSWEYRIRFDLM